MYLVTKDKQTAADGTVTSQQYVRSINVTAGQDAMAGSMLIQSNPSGSGAGYTGTDGEPVPFDPLTQNQRPALLLLNGDVYVGFSSHGDNDPYHGWLFAFNTTTLATDAAIDLSPDGLRAPVWMSGDGPAADAAGNIFVSTGNGTFDASAGGSDYADSVLRLDKKPGFTGHGVQGIVISDYFTPYDQAKIGYSDQDLGSGGVLLIPGTHDALTAGKDANVYIVNTRRLGGFNNKRNNIVQTDKTALAGNKAFFAPAYLNGTVYFAAANGKLQGFKLRGGRLGANPIGTSTETYGYPGASPSVSADGTANGIVWAIQRVLPAGADTGSGMPAGYTVLNAYNAATLTELYTSATDPAGGTTTSAAIKFATPTIADGHVFVGTADGVLEYGLTGTAAAARPIKVRRAASEQTSAVAKAATAGVAKVSVAVVTAARAAKPTTAVAATAAPAAVFVVGHRTITAAAVGGGFNGVDTGVTSAVG